MISTEIDDLFDILYTSDSEAKERVSKQLEQEQKDSQKLKDWFDKTHTEIWKPTVLEYTPNRSKVEYSGYTGYPVYPFTIDD